MTFYDSKKEKYTADERWKIAKVLDLLLGVPELNVEEHEAVRMAIRIVSPEYAKSLDDMDAECEEFFKNATEEDLKKLDEDVAAMFAQNEKVISLDKHKKEGSK